MSFPFGFGAPKLPSPESKLSVEKKKCTLDQEDILKRQLDSLTNLFNKNPSFKGFYDDFKKVNQEFQRYSQAKKIRLLLLYYIKKYNDIDTPHARDCVDYIFALNNQYKWLNTFDLNFVYGFAFNNEIINKEIKEQLYLDVNGNPLKYAVNKCNNKLAEWLINNVFSGLTLKDNQFKYIHDGINKKDCFDSRVKELFNNYYYMYDDPELKSLKLEFNKGGINALKTVLINLNLHYINTDNISEKTILGKKIMHIVKRIIKNNKDNKVFYNDILPELIANIAYKNKYAEYADRNRSKMNIKYELIPDNYIFVKYIIDRLPPINPKEIENFINQVKNEIIKFTTVGRNLARRDNIIITNNITDYIKNDLIMENNNNKGCIIS